MARRICQRCGEEKTTANYIGVNSIIHGGTLPICRQCIATQIQEEEKKGNGTWNIADKFCQWADIPFVPEEWDKIYQGNKKEAFGIYVSIFRNEKYRTLDWSSYNKVYMQIQEENRVEDALPETQEHMIRKLHQKWGQHYDLEELEYLENLHQGLLNSQNIVGALNEDQALKLCKISLVLEDKIRAGQDFSKDLKAYDDLAKLANLTPKVIKDANDFSSLGEIFAYLEKRGWKNPQFDDTTRDEIDYCMKDIKLWTRYLYVNETGVAEEIEQRIENMKVADKLTGHNFNEQEFRDYMEQQSNFNLEAEEFEPNL